MRMLKYLALVLWLTAGAPEAAGYEPAGIGVVLGVEGQNIVVKRILPDTPAAAQKAIHVGDKIMAATAQWSGWRHCKELTETHMLTPSGRGSYQISHCEKFGRLHAQSVFEKFSAR